MTNYRDFDDYSSDELLGVDLPTLRGLFRYYRQAAEYGMSRKYVQERLDGVATVGQVSPVGWIMAIRQMTATCERCSGTGRYSWGACVNGRMSHSGPCNRCGGKGYITLADCFRNRSYDRHAICRAFAC